MEKLNLYFTDSTFQPLRAHTISPATCELAFRREYPNLSKASQHHQSVRPAPKTIKTTLYAPTPVPLRYQPCAIRQTDLPSISTMCITKLSKHSDCGHWSCEIKEPCKEGRDFSNCSSFTNGVARNAAKYAQELAKEKTCPKCDKNDDYDGKKIRMVKATVHATKFGFGPNVSHHLRANSSRFVLHFELRGLS